MKTFKELNENIESKNVLKEALSSKLTTRIKNVDKAITTILREIEAVAHFSSQEFDFVSDKNDNMKKQLTKCRIAAQTLEDVFDDYKKMTKKAAR